MSVVSPAMVTAADRPGDTCGPRVLSSGAVLRDTGGPRVLSSGAVLRDTGRLGGESPGHSDAPPAPSRLTVTRLLRVKMSAPRQLTQPRLEPAEGAVLSSVQQSILTSKSQPLIG